MVVGGGEDHGEGLSTGWETQKENLDLDTELINRGKLVPPLFLTHLTLLLCFPSVPARVMCMNLITGQKDSTVPTRFWGRRGAGGNHRLSHG